MVKIVLAVGSGGWFLGILLYEADISIHGEAISLYGEMILSYKEVVSLCMGTVPHIKMRLAHV
jgi:hypothetical protein